MNLDLSQFSQTFFEESFEGLELMESALVGLSPEEVDAETINEIFRAAHSIKGGSGTFGFTAVTEFTHCLETLLDQIRGGQRPLTSDLVDLFLQAVDVLGELLSAARDGTELDPQRVQTVQQRMEQQLGVDSAVDKRTQPTPAEEQSAPDQGFEILFLPQPQLPQNGNDPLRLMRELAMLGDCQVEILDDKLPPLSELDPESCYLGWRIQLYGEMGEEDIREIFEWVEDECELTIRPLGHPIQATSAVGEEVEESEQVPPASTRAPQTNQSSPTPPRKSPLSGSSIRVDTTKVDTIINLMGELVITQSMLGQIGSEVEENEHVSQEWVEKLREGLAQLEYNTRELQESIMHIRMLPISFAFNRFPRLVRDLSTQLGKRVELQINGEQTELDKTVLEKIGDPLTHLVRNAIDHGLENPDERRRQGKPETGKVCLSAYHEGGKLVIEINDDGRGLDRDKILAKAKANGLIDESTELNDNDVWDLIFQPGFSTADQVSEVSGRGVGMDVVRNNIRELGGTIEIHSEKNQGTRFTVRLPLTLSIIDGQLVKVGDQTYVIPLTSIVESLQLQPDLLKPVGGQQKVYHLRDEYIPMLSLADTFSQVSNSSLDLMVVVETDGRKVGLLVDDLLAQQQVVIKSMETNYRKIDGVAGATILGDGTVALILDIPDLIQQAGGTTTASMAA